jgi:asparagine synthase (glutamine-hydrolysing)
MCGIVGYSGFNDDSFLLRMNDIQSHRGPDDSGKFWDRENHVGLAMRRLSILDITGGRQPMSNEDNSVVLVFNGEIFNAPALRIALESKGHRFVTDHSDTEVILRLYEDSGVDVARKLSGMFAFVVYDKRKKLLFAARDPFGIKPLYFHQHNNGIAWASELKSLRVLPSFSLDLDPVAVEQYLGLQYIPQERTIFSSARKLRPGHSFVYRLDERSLTVSRYYNLSFGKKQDDCIDVADYSTAVRGQFAEAVKRWSQSDVPIACSLSGGVDSAAIVACLARDGQKVSTYTLGYTSPADGRINELEEARQVARMYGTDHHELVLDVDELIKALPEMVWHLDEPYGGGLPSWYVFREIAKDVKVAMTGVGGDELFSNYNKFYGLETHTRFSVALYLNEHYPFAAACASNLSKIILKAKSHRGLNEHEEGIRRFHSKRDAPEFWRHPFGISYPTAHGRGFNERMSVNPAKGLSEGRKALNRTFQEYAGECLRDRCVAVDFNNQLPDEFLHMTDRFSMAFSLEARTPFLDKDFVGYVLNIPAESRLTPRDPKSLIKAAFESWLPPDYTKLRKKGFVIPMARWLRGPLRKQAEELFSEASLRRGGWIRSDFSTVYFRPFLDGQTNLTETLWTVFMFRLWEEHVLS